MIRLIDFILVVALLATAGVWAAESADLRLIPHPKEVALEDCAFQLDRPLVVHVPEALSAELVQAVEQEFKRAELAAPATKRDARLSNAIEITPAEEAPEGAGLAAPEDKGEEAYSLQVRPGDVRVAGKSLGGLAHGVSTLLQLIRANRSAAGLPCLTIRDWPSLRWRALQDDLTRGPSSTLDELKREVALGALFKHNLFTYYMEHQYAFSKHPLIGPRNGSLLPAELKQLVEFAQKYQMDILGNQQSFGHFAHILKHPQYEPLRETTWVITPMKEETYQLLDDMYSEVIPLLPFGMFNVCCDETEGLGKGPSKELAAQIGVGGVYVRHMKRVHGLIKDKYGKRMMMWGDIILNHPDNLKEIPKDTIMLTWGYEPAGSFENQITPFAKSGFDFFICPGINNWNRILPDFGRAAVNIRNFVRDGLKHGAVGMLNTAWDDDGESLNGANWHGIAWGAECSWGGSTTTLEAFNRRIGPVLFGDPTDHFEQAINLLIPAFTLPGFGGMHDPQFWAAAFEPAKTPVAAAIQQANDLLKLTTPAIEHLRACRKQATVNAELLDYFIFGAGRMQLIGQRRVDLLAAARAYRAERDGKASPKGAELAKAVDLVAKVRRDHQALADEYPKLWNRENRPYALNVPMDRFAQIIKTYSDMESKLIAARKSVDANQPLPPPAEVGLVEVEAAP